LPTLRIFGNLIAGDNIKFISANAKNFTEIGLMNMLFKFTGELLNNSFLTNLIIVSNIFKEVVWCLRNMIIINNFYVNKEFVSNKELNNYLLFYLLGKDNYNVINKLNLISYNNVTFKQLNIS